MLHGVVQINDIEIGRWTAVRMQHVIGDMYLYDCTLNYRNTGGYPLSAKFQVKHRSSENALNLASKILTVGQDFLRKKVVE